MKKIPFLLPLFLGLVAFLSSCTETKTQVFTSKSADGNVTVEVSGVQKAMGEPVTTTVKMSGFGRTESEQLELYLSDFTKETTEIQWTSNIECVLTFTQRDGEKKIIDIYFSNGGYKFSLRQ